MALASASGECDASEECLGLGELRFVTHRSKDETEWGFFFFFTFIDYLHWINVQ